MGEGGTVGYASETPRSTALPGASQTGAQVNIILW
jgi:hypothetical protein